MASGVLIAHTGMRPAEFGRLPAHAVGSRAPEPAIVQIASLRVARSVHSATALLSGHVLLVGGMADGGTMAAWPARNCLIPALVE